MPSERETLGQRPDAKLDMFAESQGLAIGTADTRVVGGNMFSTTYSYTSNVFTTPTEGRVPVPASQRSPDAQLAVERSLPWRPPEVHAILRRLLWPFLIYSRNSSAEAKEFSVSSLDDGSDTPPARKTSGEVYVYTMLHTGKGLPCWRPGPRKPLKDGEGVVPGDVGIFSIEGGFRKIFNLWDDKRSIQNSSATKSHAVPYQVPPKPRLFVKPNELAEGKALVQGAWYETIYESDNETVARFEFHHLEPHQQGAVLAMTSTGKLEELDDSDKADLREFISRYAGLLYKYADAIRRIDKYEALYIITGCIKSENWALAAFRDPVMQPGHIPKLVRLSRGKPQDATYAWRSPGTFDSYVGTSESNGSQDQALFLRGFKLDVSLKFREQAKQGGPLFTDRRGLGGGAGGPSAPPDGNEDDRNGQPDDRTERSTEGSNCGYNGGGTQGHGGHQAADNYFVVTSFPDESCLESCHPCDTINSFLLTKTGLDFALSHDDDWRMILGGPDSVSASPVPPTGQTRTSESSVISVRHGVASLSFGGDNSGSLLGANATTIPIQQEKNVPPAPNTVMPELQHSSKLPVALPPFQVDSDRHKVDFIAAPESRPASSFETRPRGRGSYAPTSCSVCRARKVRCDGERPVCVSCKNKGMQSECSFPTQQPKRKETYFESLEKRLKEGEEYSAYLLSELERCGKDHGSTTRLPTIEGLTNSANASDDDDCDDDGWGIGSSIHDLIAPIQRLTPIEGRGLIAYGSTSVFRFKRDNVLQPNTSSSPAALEAPVNTYPLLLEGPDERYGDGLDWSRYLPRAVAMGRKEHDKALDLLLKFATSWCLRVVPSLFLRDMYRALSTPKSDVSPPLAHYSPMLHNALLSLALAFSNDSILRDYKTRASFADEAKKYLESECSKPGLPAVNALSILATYHSSQGDQTLGFMYFGMSARMSQALGLDVDAQGWVAQGLVDKDDVWDRYCTYWTVFAQDIDWSLYVGRDFCLRSPSEAAFRDMSAPFLDSELNNIPFYHSPSGLPAQPSYLSRIFSSTCRLFFVSRPIMGLVNGVGKGQRANRSAVEGLLSDINLQLNTWKASLPPEVDMTPTNRFSATPHKLMMHMAYWWLLILLHRPYFHQSADTTTHGSDNTMDHAKICRRSAEQITELLGTWRQLYSLRYVPVTIVQPLFAAGTVYLLLGIRATSAFRVAVREMTQCVDSLKLLGQYLREIGESWESALKIESILTALMEQELKPAMQRRPPASLGLLVRRGSSRRGSVSSVSLSRHSMATSLPLDSPTVYSPALSSSTLYSPTLAHLEDGDTRFANDGPVEQGGASAFDVKQDAPKDMSGSLGIQVDSSEVLNENPSISRISGPIASPTGDGSSAKAQIHPPLFSRSSFDETSRDPFL